MGVLPEVKFNIIDKTYIAPPVDGNIRVYIPFFSEKGEDGKIYKLYDPVQVVSLFGNPNSFKYGNGLYYILKAVTYPDVIVWGIRLVPQDATYASALLTISGEFSTTVTEPATSQTTITVEDVSGFNVGDTVAIYNPDEPFQTVNYAQITQIDSENKKITLDISVTVDSNYTVERIPDIQASYIQNLVDNSNIMLPEKSLAIYATGKGKYYNYLRVNFTRNESIEDYYKDDETFSKLLPYVFYNVTIYEKKPTSNAKIVDQQITISLTDTTQDGNPLVHPSSGAELFAETRFKNDIYHLRVKLSPDLVELIKEKPFIYGRAFYNYFDANDVKLNGGSDGTLDFNTMKSLLIEAYNGTYNAEASLMRVSEFPFKSYEVEYVPDYTGDPDVQSAIIDFVKSRDDCLAILGAPYATNYQSDLQYRNDVMNASIYNAEIVAGEYVEIYDPYNKRDIFMPNSFIRLDTQLYVDQYLDLTEPVAGFNGGMVRTPIKNLSYTPDKMQAEELVKLQINPLIKTPDGTLFYITQLTAYKRSTYLQRTNYVKFLNKVRKDLYPRLYDLLQRKATPEIISEAARRVTEYLSNFTVDKPKMNILESFGVNVNFDENTFTLYIDITLKFVGIVENVEVNLILVK